MNKLLLFNYFFSDCNAGNLETKLKELKVYFLYFLILV